MKAKLPEWPFPTMRPSEPLKTCATYIAHANCEIVWCYRHRHKHMDAPDYVIGNARHSHVHDKENLSGEKHENPFNAFFSIINIYSLSYLWGGKSNR